MGVDIILYTGPYVEAKHGYKEVSYQFTACSHPICSRCNQRTENPFCPVCGNKTEQVTIKTTVEDVDQEQFRDSLECCGEYNELKDHHIYVIPGFTVWNCKETAERREINRHIIEQELLRAREDYGDVLLAMEKEYEQVTLKWGLILDYS